MSANLACILQPILHVIKHVHWNSVDHNSFLCVILENKDHVKVLEVELDTLKVDQFHIFQSDNEWRLNKT